MSTVDKILIADGRLPTEIAEWVAAATGSSAVPAANGRGGVYFYESDRAEVRQISGWRHAGDIRLVLDRNHLSHLEQPFEELSFIDYFPSAIEVFHTGRDRDYQYSELINIFIRLSRTATVPLAVLRQTETIIAVFTPTIGIYWMPPGSPSDPEKRDSWSPFLAEIEAASSG